jgi:hypothetical protein
MGYVIAGIVVLLLVAGFITFVVMNSMRKGGPAARGSGGPPGIGGDSTPLGDTTEHAGRQTDRGTTAEDPERNPGEDDAAQGFDPSRPAKPEDRQLRDAGAQTGGPDPESERLADRPR